MLELRVQPEPDYPTGNWNGTGILVPVNQNRNSFSNSGFGVKQLGWSGQNGQLVRDCNISFH